jgi:Protein of unknown function (DUF2924)
VAERDGFEPSRSFILYMLPRFHVHFLPPERNTRGQTMFAEDELSRIRASTVKVSWTPQGSFLGLAVAGETSNVCVRPEKERERMKCSLADNGGLSAQIENLENLGPEELDQTWRALFGCNRPRRVCGDLLIKALGYRLQEKAIGALRPSTRRLLERWGRNRSERGPSAEPARTRLKAGTGLVREWHGVTHRVTAVDDGFDFDGERFRSLSEIARKIVRPKKAG